MGSAGLFTWDLPVGRGRIASTAEVWKVAGASLMVALNGLAFVDATDRPYHDRVTHSGGNEFDGYPFANAVLCGQTPERLTVGQRAAIEAYALNGYEHVNSALRGLIPLTPAVARRIEQIRSGLRRYPLPQTLRVTREVDAWALGITDLESVEDIIGDTYTELGFMSTSGLEMPPHSRRHEDPVILELLVPAGTPALRLGELATVADESEILVVDVRTYLPTSAVFDQRRKMWRIRAIVFEEEQR